MNNKKFTYKLALVDGNYLELFTRGLNRAKIFPTWNYFSLWKYTEKEKSVNFFHKRKNIKIEFFL